MEEQATKQQNMQQRELAVFDNLNAAEKAKELLQKAEVSLQNIRIEGDINRYEEVAALGTTVGPEAGLLIGGFFGGTLGVILFSIYSTMAYGELVNTNFGRLMIAVLAIGGALAGILFGNRLRAGEPLDEKQKGNPNIPRRFQLMGVGSPENLTKAGEILGYPAS